METENLIISGIDHSVFDLEWAKRGGVVRHFDGYAQYLKAIDFFTDVHASLFWSLTDKTCKYLKNGLRMATQSECAEAGIEYIEPPARWLPIESAPKNKLVLLYRKTVENDLIYVGGYQDGEWCTENGKVTNEPHYWMPLKLPNALAEASAMKGGE